MAFHRILHLSDLHMGRTYLPAEELACRIADDIGRNGIRDIRSILVTGDIFDGREKERKDLIPTAVGFFEVLLEELRADGSGPALTKEDVLFVPGNHDQVWSTDEEERWTKYRALLEAFYGRIPDWYDLTDMTFLRAYPEEKLVFLGFNSCGLERVRPVSEVIRYCGGLKEEAYQAKGIDRDALLALLEESGEEKYEDFGEIPARQMMRQRRRMRDYAGYRAAALFHHHFFLFPDVARQLGDADVLRDHAAVVRGLRSMGVDTVFHGHKHFDLERPFIDDQYYEGTDSVIDVFAGGSAGASGLQRHTFSVVDLYPAHEAVKLRQRKFIYQEDHLEPIRTIQIPPAAGAGRIVELEELVKDSGSGLWDAYQGAVMGSDHLYRACRRTAGWVGEVLTGYPAVSAALETDSIYALCVLCAVALRACGGIMDHDPGERAALETVRGRLEALCRRELGEALTALGAPLFEERRLDRAAAVCARLIERAGDQRARRQLAFLMVGAFFTDLELALTEQAGRFCQRIAHKVNIKLEPGQFHLHVPAQRIEVKGDPDRRSAYVRMWCDDATAHKTAALLVKEFDLVMGRLEDIFHLIGLKLYYLLPQIEKDPAQDALDDYNFEAYIPTLLPLLIGDNIYHDKNAFARELIQNAIDALAVREAVEGRLPEEERVIRIDLGRDETGRRIFQIRDHGTGMDRYKVERYFTSIGRSFYTGEDYAELGIGYQPISSFGIGFLSSFMVCREVDVLTHSFQGEGEDLKLHIPNYEGCFFIERGEPMPPGTTVRLYLEEAPADRAIADHIWKTIQSVQYPIEIHTEGGEPVRISAYQLRRPEGSAQLFVPFLPDGQVGTWGLAEGIPQDGHGLLVDLDVWDRRPGFLNAGIRIGDISALILFGGKTRDRLEQWAKRAQSIKSSSIRYVFDFPASWIQLDVSRERAVGFSAWMGGRHKDERAGAYVCTALARALEAQTLELLERCRRGEAEVSAQAVDELEQLLLALWKDSGSAEAWKPAIHYMVRTRLTARGIELQVLRSRKRDDTGGYADAESVGCAVSAYRRLTEEAGKGGRDAWERRWGVVDAALETMDRSWRTKPQERPDRDACMALVGLYQLLLAREKGARQAVPAAMHYRERGEGGWIRAWCLRLFTAGEVERGEAVALVSYEDILRGWTELTGPDSPYLG